MFSMDQSDVLAQIGIHQQQLLLSLSKQIIFGGMEFDKMGGEQQQMALMEEQLKQKELRKCNELWTEFVAKILFAQSPMDEQQDAMPPTLSLPTMSPFSTTCSSVRSNSCSEPTTPTEMSSTASEETMETMTLQLGKQQVKVRGDQESRGPGKERKHKCDQCQKAFRFKSNLFEHKSLHLGSASRNPFVCPFCSKTCRLKGNLKKHLQVHVTSSEDLECLWKRSFSRSSGRPSKNAPPAPLPKPGDDLGMVPVIVPQQDVSSSSASFGCSSIIKWTLPQNRNVSSPPGQCPAENVNLEYNCEANARNERRWRTKSPCADGSVLHSLLGDEALSCNPLNE